MQLEGLLGTWRLQRKLGGQVLSGEATFAREGDGLLYHESLTMPTPNGPVLGHRSYLYLLHGHQLRLLHAGGPQKGGLFLQFPLHEKDACWSGKGRHVCGADVYDAEIAFLLPERWQFAVEVEGPRKAFAWHTDYDRITS